MAALYTLQEAETYYTDCMLPSDAWREKMTPSDKTMAIEFVTRRLEALPWREAYSAADVRKLSSPLEAAFFAYLQAVTADWCAREFPVAATSGGDANDLLSVLADIPRNVSARLLPFLDANYLTPVAQRSNADGRKAKPLVEDSSSTSTLLEKF